MEHVTHHICSRDPLGSGSHRAPLVSRGGLERKGKLRQRVINRSEQQLKVCAMVDSLVPAETERESRA